MTRARTAEARSRDRSKPSVTFVESTRRPSKKGAAGEAPIQ